MGWTGRTVAGERYFCTGWRPCSDWTDKELGSAAAINVDGSIVHNLNAPIWALRVEVWFADITGGTDPDTNAFSLTNGQWAYDRASAATSDYGIQVRTDSTDPYNSITVHTGSEGILLIDSTGTQVVRSTHARMYLVKVIKEIEDIPHQQ